MSERETRLRKILRMTLHATRVRFDDYHGFTEKKAKAIEWCAHCDIVAQETVKVLQTERRDARTPGDAPSNANAKQGSDPPQEAGE